MLTVSGLGLDALVIAHCSQGWGSMVISNAPLSSTSVQLIRMLLYRYEIMDPKVMNQSEESSKAPEESTNPIALSQYSVKKLVSSLIWFLVFCFMLKARRVDRETCEYDGCTGLRVVLKEGYDEFRWCKRASVSLMHTTIYVYLLLTPSSYGIASFLMWHRPLPHMCVPVHHFIYTLVS